MRLLLALFMLSGWLSATPTLFFSDLTSGPNSGGETSGSYSGAYVTLYGNHFGATQGSSTVTMNGSACMRVVSWGGSWMWYQKIVVQLGSTCASGSIAVTTSGGTSNPLVFTVRTGNIYCVATSGSDSANGKFPTCWKTVLHARDQMVAGDTVYFENGVSQTVDDGTGFRTTVLLYSGFNAADGNAANPIAWLAYPGATVTIGNSLGNPNFGIRVAVSYWVFSGITFRGDVAVSFEATNGQLIGSDVSCYDPASEIQSCVHAGGADHIYVYGNNVHDTTHASSKLAQGIYMSTDTNHVWIGWNTVANSTVCNGIQMHSSPTGDNGDDQFDIHIHDNVVHDIGCSGIDIATVDPSKGPVEVYNNVVYHTGTTTSWSDGSTGYNMACIYAPGILNHGSAGSGTVEIFNNTLYDCGPVVTDFTTNSAFQLVAGSSPNIRYNLRNNIVYNIASNELYLTGDTSVVTCTGPNDWFGNGTKPAVCSSDVNVDPRFVDAANHDFHLQATSPLLDTGATIAGATTDIDGVTRPQNSIFDLGAYELLTDAGEVTPAAGSSVSGSVLFSGAGSIQ